MRVEQVEFTKFALSEGDRYALKAVDKESLRATNSVNCRCVDGKMYIGLGLTYLKSSSGKNITTDKTVKNVVAASYLENNMEKQCAVLIDSNGKLYMYYEAINGFSMLTPTIGGNIGVCYAVGSDGNSGAFIVSSNGLVQTGNKVNILQERSGMASGGVCVFKDRVFYSVGNSVLFSDAGNYLDFTESAYGGGKIEIWEGGRVWQLLPFDGSILAFKEQMVFRIHASGAADEFRIERLDFCGGKIARGSAAVCGRYVMFVTADGNVYRFNGSAFEKIAAGIPREYCKDFKGTASDGVRYFRSGESFTLIMETDGTSYYSYLVEGLTGCGDMAVGFYEGKLCRFDPMADIPFVEHSTFKVEPFILKDEREKIVRKVTVYGTGIAYVYLVGERGKLNTAVVLGEDGVEMQTEIKGKTFELSLELSTYGRIDKIVFEYTTIGEER